MRNSRVIGKVLAAVCVVVTILGNVSLKETPNDLLLENIEVLATGENIPETLCVATGSLVCPITGQKVAYVVEGFMLDE